MFHPKYKESVLYENSEYKGIYNWRWSNTIYIDIIYGKGVNAF